MLPRMSLDDAMRKRLSDLIAVDEVVLFMKGHRNAPQCGFSAQATQVLMACGARFSYVNILDNPEIRATLPKIANWPTFPQLWVDGELVGGSDIVVEMYEKGELKPLLDNAGSDRDRWPCG